MNFEAGSSDPQHKRHIQRHPTIYGLNLLILMTIYDINCSSKYLIQESIENFEIL